MICASVIYARVARSLVLTERELTCIPLVTIIYWRERRAVRSIKYSNEEAMPLHINTSYIEGLPCTMSMDVWLKQTPTSSLPESPICSHTVCLEV